MDESKNRHLKLVGLWAALMVLFCGVWWQVLLDTFRFGGLWHFNCLMEYVFLSAFLIGPAVLTERVLAVQGASAGLLSWLRLLRLTLGLGGVLIPAILVPHFPPAA